MKVGNRTILISETLFAQDGEAIEIEHEICEGDTLKIRLIFTQDMEHEGAKNPVVLYQSLEDWVEFKFANFTSQLGATTNSPSIFALSNKGEPISYMATAYKLKSGTKIELQVMMEIAS